MSIYEQRLEQDLRKITSDLITIGESVEQAIANAMVALLKQDRKLAYQTILEDNPINRAAQKVTSECHQFVARHLPSAGHLRFISSVLRMVIGLERVGDYACTICRESVQLKSGLSPEIISRIEKVAGESRNMLHRAIMSFKEKNVDLARETMGMAFQIDRDYDSVFEKLVDGEMGIGPITQDILSILVIFNNFERVSDQAKNICEETVFTVTGETKRRKPVPTLFLDKQDNILGPMARAIGSKAFSNSGRFVSAGSQPEKSLDPGMLEFMHSRGYDLSGSKPGNLEWLPSRITEFKVMVVLEGKITDYVERVPFHTVVLEWELPTPPAADSPANEARERYEMIYKELAVRLRDLMTTLRGEGAC